MATAIFSPYKANEGGVTYPRDASFSSYLDTSERDFVRSLAESINNSPSYARDISTPRKSMGRNIYRAQPSGELGVFRAERYFNENIDEKIKGSPLSRNYGDGGNYTRQRHHRRREKRDDLLESRSSRSNVSTSSSLKSPTPTLKSEGSFHSHFGLLLPKKGSIGHKIFSSFQCKGSCFDKKSVFTTNTHQIVQSSPKSSQGNNGNGSRKSRHSHQEHFAFPIIDTESISLKHDHFPKSMDVFGFHQLGKQELAHNLEKNLSILAWDAIPNTPTTSFPIQLAKKTSASSTLRTYQDEDACSDVSSDLFEIDNLSGVRGSQTSTPCYEPSEGSIEWSVVTATATDHFSSFSDPDEDDYKTAITIERRKVQKSSTSGGIFLGCTNHKAVDVVGNHYNQRP